jgi:hypothetical protein
MFLLLTLGLMNGLYKTAPLRVNPVCQQIVVVVHVAIHLEGHATTFTSQQINYEGGPVKYIDVIIASKQAEKSMPNPQELVNYGL